MAKSVLAGQMKTKITIKKLTAGMDSEGYQTETWENIFPNKIWCKWVNSHGKEVFDHLRMELGEVVTVTTRYSPKIDQRCRIWWETDADNPNAQEREKKAYEIISIDNVEDGRQFLEIKIRRAVVA